MYAVNLSCKFLSCRGDIPPAPVSHCCSWCHRRVAKPTGAPAPHRHALFLQQERMFNTRGFSPWWESWKVILKKYNRTWCVLSWYRSASYLTLSFLYLHTYASSSRGTQMPVKSPNCSSQHLWSECSQFLKATLFRNCQVLNLNRLQVKQVWKWDSGKILEN